MDSTNSKVRIGVFDSGVGGLSVLKELLTQLPGVEYFYFADQLHVPYGRRSKADIQRLSRVIVEFLFEKKVEIIVIACNTATAKALTYLREIFPDRHFVGTEPALKPAAAATDTGKVAVLATQGTFQSDRYTSLTERFANEVEVFENPCYGLVELVEAGKLDDPETENLLRGILAPMLAAGADTVVLGCTHYPFIEPTLRKIIGEKIKIINPAPAVARQTTKIFELMKFEAWGETLLHFYTTGDPEMLERQIEKLLSLTAKAEKVEL